LNTYPFDPFLIFSVNVYFSSLIFHIFVDVLNTAGDAEVVDAA